MPFQDGPVEGADLRVLSLGAGVQSTTLALMAAHGEVEPMPDFAVFADTQAEPAEVYRHLDWLETVLPFEVRRASCGSLTENIIESVKGGRFAGAPFFTESPSGGGMLRRQCTREFKISPIQQEVRRALGLVKRQRAAGKYTVEQWIGISMDEVQRMKPSRDEWVVHRWPLIEKRMTRNDCLQWMAGHGYPTPPKSACTFCPYHSDAEWARLRDMPEEWAGIVEIDRLIRGGVRGTKERLYLHRSLRPIDEVDLTDADRGQLSLFDNECEGMCGV